MQPPKTRPSLILKLKDSQNESAWADFAANYEPFLQRLVARQGVPARHVADVSQHVMWAIARSVDAWQDDGREASFRRWMHRVARNVVIKFMTRERRQVGGQGGTDLVELLREVPAIPDREQERRYEQELVLWAAEQVRNDFQDSSWQAFWMTLVEQRDVDDVSGQLSMSRGAIYMARSRIVLRIREHLEKLSQS